MDRKQNDSLKKWEDGFTKKNYATKGRKNKYEEVVATSKVWFVGIDWLEMQLCNVMNCHVSL